MKKLIPILVLLWSSIANAQFTPGQLLTASELNTQFALYAPLAGATFTGPIAVPSGSFSLGSLAAQPSNTIVSNATGSNATPTAITIPSCSTSSSALNWTTSGGASALTCNTAVNAATLGGATFASPGAIGSTTASTGRFTSITTTTGGANITGGLTVTSGGVGITGGLLMSTGAITPVTTQGIVGTTLGDNAIAGSVGELQTSTTSSTSLTNNVGANCTSISLPAGDWDVSGEIQYNAGATTTISALYAGISTTSATLGGIGTYQNFTTTFGTGSSNIIATPVFRESLTSTTTVYIVGLAVFGTSTMTCNGLIRARRVR